MPERPRTRVSKRLAVGSLSRMKAWRPSPLVGVANSSRSDVAAEQRDCCVRLQKGGPGPYYLYCPRSPFSCFLALPPLSHALGIGREHHREAIVSGGIAKSLTGTAAGLRKTPCNAGGALHDKSVTDFCGRRASDMTGILALLIVAAFAAAIVMALTSIRAVAGPSDPEQSRKPDLRERYSVGSFVPMSNARYGKLT